MKISVFATLLAVVLCSGASTTHAQEATKPQVGNKQTEQPPVPYRLDFTLVESQAGKKINTRHYTLNLNVGTHDDIKIATKVPVEVNKVGEIQYMDVGTDIWSRLEDEENSLALQVRAEISSFALPDEAAHPGNDPIIRVITISGSTVVVAGKPVSIGSLEDPNSDRQFQLEVTVTKLTP